MNLSWIQRTAEEIHSETDRIISAHREKVIAIKHIPAEQRTFENTIAALEYAANDLADSTQQCDLLVNVHPDESIRNACQQASAKLEAYSNEVNYDRDIYRAVQEWHALGEKLDGVDGRLVEDIMRDQKRIGFHLPSDKFKRLREIADEKAVLEQEFERAINEYEDHIEVSQAQLAGLPDRYIEGLRRTKDDKYIVSLQYPELFPFMDLADENDARKELATKNLHKGGPDNLNRLAYLITLRQEAAGLLGYNSHAEYVQELYMAKKPEVVNQFLSDIIKKLAPGVRKDLRELIDLKKIKLNLETPAPIHFYETAYWSNKAKKEKYDFDPELLKEYFPLDHVLVRMLELYQDVLGLKFERSSEKLWHEDAELYKVTDSDSGKLLGHFALDLYPREGKYGHAATFPIVLSRKDADGAQTPGLVALVCNYPKPTLSNPSLLAPHNEGVETLLHEFGHVVHALVSGGKWQRQNGFGVPLDFVETPSQAFEYWVWDSRSITKLSKHHKTGEPVPTELLEKFLASRNHQQASYYSTQAVRALYDLRIHSQPVDMPVESQRLSQLYRDMILEFMHIDLPDSSLFPSSWGHMADYDAGYYSYLWSKVYAADLFSKFLVNPLDSRTGHEYRAKVLEPGASSPEMQLIEDFLGRPPSNAAFLAEIGI